MNNRSITAVIVLHYGAVEDTTACVASLLSSTIPLAIVVVDNGSDMNTHQKLCTQIPTGVHILHNKHNLGYAGGNNVGIRFALETLRSENVIILNNDTAVEPNFAEALVRALDPTIHTEMIAPLVKHFGKHDNIETMGLRMSRNGLGYKRTQETQTLACPAGSCALYTSRLLRDIAIDGEYFDEDFFLYNEDLDLGVRALLMGYHPAFVKNAVVYHKISASAGGERGTISVYYGHRNSIFVAIKCFPRPIWLLRGAVIVGVQLLAIPFYLFRYPRYVTLVVRAKFAALRLLPRMLKKREIIQKHRSISSNSFNQYFTD